MSAASFPVVMISERNPLRCWFSIRATSPSCFFSIAPRSASRAAASSSGAAPDPSDDSVWNRPDSAELSTLSVTTDDSG
jgi:hypothetical protein